eukprot:CAMPEP_0115890416 /NCGR_PEP_ID=MMETSP0287-20121206/33342_1 /TAXON_ID=412157 /ORGANISM="Chrysochromulina rotalis, Strain UIO044" /LENGTH=52 /DNA_ID=CAMNT_0003347191 /DNA_START=781 /DNA_END=936 /DNA_ORIENTATION=+
MAKIAAEVSDLVIIGFDMSAFEYSAPSDDATPRALALISTAPPRKFSARVRV